MVEIKLDILETPLNEIVGDLYSQAYDGRDVHHCYEQPVNALLHPTMKEDADAHVDIQTIKVPDVVNVSGQDMWAVIYRGGDQIGSHNTPPYSYSASKPPVAGMFSDAMDAVGKVMALAKANGEDILIIKRWFENMWGVKGDLNYHVHVPSLEKAETVGFERLEANVAPTLKAYLGKHHAVNMKVYGTNRQVLSQRAGRDVTFNWAKFREVLKGIGLMAVLDGSMQYECKLKFRANHFDAADRVKKPVRITELLLRDDVEAPVESFYVKEYERIASAWLDKMVEEKLETANDNVVIDEKLIGKPTPLDFVGDPKFAHVNLTDLRAALYDTTEDDVFAEVKRNDARDRVALRDHWSLSDREAATVIDAVVSKKVAYHAHYVLGTNIFTPDVRKKITSTIMGVFTEEVYNAFITLMRLTKVHADAWRSAAQRFWRNFGVNMEEFSYKNFQKRLDTALKQDDNYRKMHVLLSMFHSIRERQAQSVDYLQNVFVKNIIKDGDFALAVSKTIDTRVSQWRVLYANRSKVRVNSVKSQYASIRDQLRAKFVGCYKYRVSEDLKVLVEDVKPEFFDKLISVADSIKRRHTKYAQIDLDKLRRDAKTKEDLVTKLDHVFTLKYKFRELVDDLSRAVNLVALDISNVLNVVSVAIANRRQAMVRDAELLLEDDAMDMSDYDDNAVVVTNTVVQQEAKEDKKQDVKDLMSEMEIDFGDDEDSDDSKLMQTTDFLRELEVSGVTVAHSVREQLAKKDTITREERIAVLNGVKLHHATE